MRKFETIRISIAENGPRNGEVLGYYSRDDASGGYPWINDHKFPDNIIFEVEDYWKSLQESHLCEFSDGGMHASHTLRLAIGAHDKVYVPNSYYKFKFERITIDATDILNIKSTVTHLLIIEAKEAVTYLTRGVAFVRIIEDTTY